MNDNSNTKVIVGLSGGVDSAVAALILKQQGYAVEGMFMKNWEDDDTETSCGIAQDLADVEAVCEILEIPLHKVNFAAEYWDNVFKLFLDGYKAGVTPNPDILCNKEIKFKVFLEHAERLGADKIATGHYARCDTVNGNARLLKGLDTNKDQSYFLHAVQKKALEQTIFPLGYLAKSEVRKKAESYGLPNAKKKDSTGICFIGKKNFRQFMKRYLPAKVGNIVDRAGQVLGKHEGVFYYTLGQRQGLNVGGVKDSLDSPWYVIDKKVATNELVVSQDEQQLLYRSNLLAIDINWIEDFPGKTFNCSAKSRYRQQDQSCEVLIKADGSAEVKFEEPQRALTPGQSVVFYNEDNCLGGGTIANTW